jgi:hypothetical protein
MSPRATARPPFRLEVEPHLEVVVVRARGVLDADAAGQLDECLCALWEVGLRRVHLDLTGVSGIGAHTATGTPGSPDDEVARARRQVRSRRQL